VDRRGVNTPRDTARKPVASGKGLLAMDESNSACAKRFAAAGMPQTEEAGRAYPRLYVIRHGETAWSLSGQHTGRTDIPLTARGRAGAVALGREIRDVQFSHIFASPMRRAQRTCELARPDLTTEIEPDLGEWDYGDYEGKLSVDIRAKRPGWSVFRDGCPRGETPVGIADRADRLIARLGALTGNVALFTHGQFACVLAMRWTGMPIAEATHFVLDTASVSILASNPDHPEVRVIALWNLTPNFE
jgi:probable phosphoglycerate mutase